jgi:hypothetical protein
MIYTIFLNAMRVFMKSRPHPMAQHVEAEAPAAQQGRRVAIAQKPATGHNRQSRTLNRVALTCFG